jgi:hypothetical protein
MGVIAAHKLAFLPWTCLDVTQHAEHLVFACFAGRGLASLLREGLPSRRRVHTVHSSRTHDATCFIIHAHYGKPFSWHGYFCQLIILLSARLSHFR